MGAATSIWRGFLLLMPQLTYTPVDPKERIVLIHTLREVGAMGNKRLQFSERRYKEDMPRVPFKDSNGATITECRRRIPDRRIANIQSEWLDVEKIDIHQRSPVLHSGLTSTTQVSQI